MNTPVCDVLSGHTALPLVYTGKDTSSLGVLPFAAIGDEEQNLYGRNFDWQFSPAVLLFTDPPDGTPRYRSISPTWVSITSRKRG
jgi:hypothetical protein